MTAMYGVDNVTYRAVLQCNGARLVFSPVGRLLDIDVLPPSNSDEVNVISCIQRNGCVEVGRLVNREFTKFRMTSAEFGAYIESLELGLKSSNVAWLATYSVQRQVTPEISVLQTLYIFK